VYGQIGIKGGTYIAANSSSTQDLASNILGVPRIRGDQMRNMVDC
jgi:hypothetical protein